MVVSLRTPSGLSLDSLKTISVVVGAVAGAAFYLYGPAVTPTMHASAVETCNELTGGNYRSYRLSWVLAPRPHWSCWDASDPTVRPLDLGWWVSTR